MARKPRASRSMAGRVALVVVATATAVAAVTLAFDRWLDSPVLAGVTALLVTLPTAVWLTNAALRPLEPKHTRRDRWHRQPARP